MGSYTANGKQVLHVEGDTVTHIADAGDNEKAHSIAYHMNAQSAYYMRDAGRTLSPAWHGDKVAKHLFVGAINNAIKAANELDKFKKTLFYGRDNNLSGAEGQANVSDLPSHMAMPIGADATNVIHAIIGKFTEAGELLEALKACYNGDTFDRINAIEEVGDDFWYDAILLTEMDSDFENAQARNIAKLRARYPDKFEAVNANERDLAAERAILEDGLAPMQDEGDLHVAFEPTKPASGPEAVSEAAAKADTAFAAVAASRAASVDAGELIKPTVDLSKSIGEREHLMPGEVLARQPIRKSDA
jgi:hypothetical protein